MYMHIGPARLQKKNKIITMLKLGNLLIAKQSIQPIFQADPSIRTAFKYSQIGSPHKFGQPPLIYFLADVQFSSSIDIFANIKFNFN